MEEFFGTLFYDINEKNVISIRCDPDCDYDTFITRCRQAGFHPFFLTSEMMIGLSDHLFMKYNYETTSIDMFGNRMDLHDEIASILMNLNQNEWDSRCNSYRVILKNKISYLSKYEGVDIHKIDCINTLSGVTFSICSNGMISAPIEHYYDVSDFVCRLIVDLKFL